MANTIGEAYLQIRPSMEGVKGELESAMSDAGASGSASYGFAFNKGIKAMAGASAALVGSSIAGTAAITKSAVDAYADYEQLSGGVETLFGDSFSTVMQNADKAFATAGMNANDYMETAIQSGAAMISSLDGDTARASELMDMSITDMADNVNKMGTSMEAVQNAYRGFSRGNFTMLDNLALGFAGTKEGMQELIDKASEISGIEYDIGNYSDIVEAIHVVQTEMGITGTTAEEASGTISGSMASAKAAFDNLIAGLANPDADMGALIQNLVDTGLAALNNLMPTIVNALTGIAQALPQIVDAFVQLLPTVLPVIIPPLIDAAITLIQALVDALPMIMEVLIAVLPDLIQTIVDTVITLLPLIIDLGLQLILALADGLIAALPDLIPAIVDVILTIVDKLTEPDTILQLVNATIQLMGAIIIGIVKAIPSIIMKVPEIIMNIITTLTGLSPDMVKAGLDALLSFLSGIIDNVKKAIDAGRDLFNSVKDGIMEKIEGAKNWGKDLIDNFVQGIKDKFQKVKDTLKSLGDLIKGMIGFSEPEDPASPLHNFHTFAPDMMKLFSQGIEDNLGLITSAMNDVSGTVATDFSSARIAPNYSGIATPGDNAYGMGGMALAGDGNITIPVYIGQEKIDTIIINAQQRHALVSGGR